MAAPEATAMAAIRSEASGAAPPMWIVAAKRKLSQPRLAANASDLPTYQILISAQHDLENTESEIYFDNFKLVHLKQ